jgi:hypothetical protein
MKRLLFVLLMMTCSISWAAWEMTGNTKNDTFYHDKSTIRRNGAIAKMWSMIDSFEDETNSDGTIFKSQKVFRVANCRERTVATISLFQYSGSMGEGSVVLTRTIKESEWNWTPIPPGSIAEAEWKIVCGKR